MKRKLVGAGLLVLVACGPEERNTERYPGTRTDPVLTEARHPAAWGRRECLLCHNINLNVHRNPGSPVDADQLAAETRRRGGDPSYCMRCHGKNGTQ